jgi:hypothetical protein
MIFSDWKMSLFTGDAPLESRWQLPFMSEPFNLG